MSKRRKWIVVLACILMLALVWAFLPEREPSYQGRKLSQWVDQMEQSGWNSAEAQGAIRAIGTNAIPTSLKWISYQSSPSRKNIAALVGRLAPRLSRVILNPEARAYHAMDVFLILGAEARAAIPELTRLAQTSADPERADRCIQVLTWLGPEALPSVLTLVTNNALHSRIAAIRGLQTFGTNAAAAVPMLIQSLDDEDCLVAMMALGALRHLDVDRSAKIVSLTNAMRSFSMRGRLRAVDCLLWLDSPPSEAVLVLLPMLNDPGSFVRGVVTNALLRIAPEVLTNAPPQ